MKRLVATTYLAMPSHAALRVAASRDLALEVHPVTRPGPEL